jgi:predicted alpha/beta hydrolase
MPSAARGPDSQGAQPRQHPEPRQRLEPVLPAPAPDTTPYEQRWLERGGDRIGLQWYEPPPEPAAPLLLIWPAMGVPARFYRPFATALREAGLAVVVVDLRGTGASQPRPSRASRYGYADLADDVGAVLAHLPPGRRVVLVGHSLGGQACVLHLARSAAPAVAGLALVAVGLPYWRSYQDRRRLIVLPFAEGVRATAAVLRVWPGWGFGGRQSRGVMRDWAYTARTGRFPALSGVDTEAALAAVRVPVLAVSLERDQYTPAPTVDYLVGKLSAAPVQREHYDGGVDHFSWARSPTPIASRVATFAATVTAPAS